MGAPVRTVKGKQTLHDFFDKIVFLYDNYSKLKFLQEHLLLSFLLLANKQFFATTKLLQSDCETLVSITKTTKKFYLLIPYTSLTQHLILKDSGRPDKNGLVKVHR